MPWMSALPPILLIDDDPDDLFIFRRLLAKAGVQNKIVAFDDAAAAMDYLDLESRNPDRRFLPCVTLTDLHMPGVNGLEVTAWIRAHPVLNTMAVIVLSSSEAPEDEARAKARGATRFLRKYPSSHGLSLLIAGLPCATVASSQNDAKAGA